ncbi:MAG: hypothetical protein ACR5LG_10495 [Sodalis sp. (in: enterobacteria)]|uniref:hypothetical protein n=1 Tax=Sodalis sp. (in: enterobacteria) TaxID=1898979 RepID=UPI003F34309A
MFAAGLPAGQAYFAAGRGSCFRRQVARAVVHYQIVMVGGVREHLPHYPQLVLV